MNFDFIQGVVKNCCYGGWFFICPNKIQKPYSGFERIISNRWFFPN